MVVPEMNEFAPSDESPVEYRSSSADGASGERSDMAALGVGRRGRVASLTCRGALRQRLLDMGIIPGVILSVERVALTGEPIWISLRGAQLSLRRAEASSVEVIPCPEPGPVSRRGRSRSSDA
jgi:Fe2+ transport system protein FeoA